jgi:hypothetical protein
MFDGFVKSLKSSFGVIPAKAGIQYFQIVLDACLRRHDGISDFLRNHQCWMFHVQGLKSASGGFTVPAGGVSYEMSGVMERRC